jgi:hypothetical protein
MADGHDPLTAERVKRGVLSVGGAFGQSPEFRDLVERLGVGRWPTYFAARAGVMGDVEPEVVAAAFGFFSPEHVARCLRDAARAGSPSAIAGEDRAAMDRWGRRAFDGMANVARAATLAQQVVVSADPAGLPMFAALRAADTDDDDVRAQLAHALMCLREHRGGLYLLAVRAVGLSPLDAVLAQGGGDKALANGWKPPYTVAPDATRRREDAEHLADHLAQQAYSVLSSGQANELADHIQAIEARLPPPENQTPTT